MAQEIVTLPHSDIPSAWYNVLADLPQPLPPPLHPGTGKPLGPTIRAVRTVTMAAMKKGFRNPAAALYTGDVTLADIGVPFSRRQS